MFLSASQRYWSIDSFNILHLYWNGLSLVIWLHCLLCLQLRYNSDFLLLSSKRCCERLGWQCSVLFFCNSCNSQAEESLSLKDCDGWRTGSITEENFTPLFKQTLCIPSLIFLAIQPMTLKNGLSRQIRINVFRLKTCCQFQTDSETGELNHVAKLACFRRYRCRSFLLFKQSFLLLSQTVAKRRCHQLPFPFPFSTTQQAEAHRCEIRHSGLSGGGSISCVSAHWAMPPSLKYSSKLGAL